jgi:hypothetical protein
MRNVKMPENNFHSLGISSSSRIYGFELEQRSSRPTVIIQNAFGQRFEKKSLKTS